MTHVLPVWRGREDKERIGTLLEELQKASEESQFYQAYSANLQDDLGRARTEGREDKDRIKKLQEELKKAKKEVQLYQACSANLPDELQSARTESSGAMQYQPQTQGFNMQMNWPSVNPPINNCQRTCPECQYEGNDFIFVRFYAPFGSRVTD
ncbi:uncharacterized protein LOC117332109 [Pecten maximus]|uniref:uncharacterized protein LOC117332109 n=1 Tax=Pecten maximus TaxID=6579 RepID=UPI0014590503|nr:uncharacterized protein LOC117332109 [Pecten maximus]